MTTPVELTRVLLWVRDLLGRLATDETLASGTSARALTMLAAYPTASDINDWVASALPELPQGAGVAIDSASALFYELPLHDGVDGDYKSLLVDVQRHFPLPGSALDAARQGIFGGIKEWLAEC